MIGFLQISSFRRGHCLPFSPRKCLPEWVSRHLVMSPPDYGFHVMSEQYFGAGPIPGNHPNGHDEITDDDIVSFLRKQVLQRSTDLRSAKLCNVVRLPREEANAVIV